MNLYKRYVQLRERARMHHSPKQLDNFPEFDEWLADQQHDACEDYRRKTKLSFFNKEV